MLLLAYLLHREAIRALHELADASIFLDSEEKCLSGRVAAVVGRFPRVARVGTECVTVGGSCNDHCCAAVVTLFVEVPSAPTVLRCAVEELPLRWRCFAVAKEQFQLSGDRCSDDVRREGYSRVQDVWRRDEHIVKPAPDVNSARSLTRTTGSSIWRDLAAVEISALR